MIAYHWLKDDMRAGHGREKAWEVGEERSVKAKEIVICKHGYHSSPSPWLGLEYAPGSNLCIVEIGEPSAQEADKYVSRTRKLRAVVNVEKELRQFAIDCAERALARESATGREPDARSWAAIEAAKASLRGEITPKGLAAARDAARTAARTAARDAAEDAARTAARDAARTAAEAAARDAARAAAWAAAWAAARDAAEDAARDAAWAAAGAAEYQWQEQHFRELVMPRVSAIAKALDIELPS